MTVRALCAQARGAWSRVWRDSRGAAALEFALTAPTLFLLIFGGVEFGRFMWTQSALQMSVAQAERCYAWQVSGCTSASGVQTFAANVAPQLRFSTSTFTLSPAGCVTASYQYNFIARGLFPWVPTLTASACFPIV